MPAFLPGPAPWFSPDPTGAVVVAGAADLTGVGSSTSAGVHTAVGVASLTGTGSSTTVGVRTRLGAATLTGTGSSTSAGAHTAFATAALVGNGTLATNGTRTRFGAATLTGTGTSTTAGVRTRFGASALTGLGTLTCAGVRTRSGAAALTGTGSATTAGFASKTGAAALTGTGSSTSAGVRTRFAVSTLTGSGSLTAAGDHVAYAATDLVGNGALTTDGTRVRFGAATLAGTGTSTTAGGRTRLGAADLTGTGTLSATAEGTAADVSGAADLTGAGTLAAAGDVEAPSVIQGGSYGYSYPLHRSVPAVEPPPAPQPEPAVVFATARLTGHGTLAATGVRTIVGQADLAAVTFALAAGIRATSGAAELAASTSGSVAGTRTVYTAAALAATVTVELSGYATMAAAARLHASTTGDVVGTRTVYSGARFDSPDGTATASGDIRLGKLSLPNGGTSDRTKPAPRTRPADHQVRHRVRLGDPQIQPRRDLRPRRPPQPRRRRHPRTDRSRHRRRTPQNAPAPKSGASPSSRSAAPIVPHADAMTEISGGASVDGFLTAFRAALADPDVAHIVLDIDSPGGAVDLIPEAAAEIRAGRARKPVTAIANTDAASAAYWLASQASELVVTPSGKVGSIGVFAAHDDISAAQEKLGVKTTLISAGDHKTEESPFEPLTQEARDAIQARVDGYYRMFVADVAKGRGVDVGAVEASYGQGRMLLGRRRFAGGDGGPGGDGGGHDPGGARFAAGTRPRPRRDVQPPRVRDAVEQRVGDFPDDAAAHRVDVVSSTERSRPPPYPELSVAQERLALTGTTSAAGLSPTPTTATAAAGTAHITFNDIHESAATRGATAAPQPKEGAPQDAQHQRAARAPAGDRGAQSRTRQRVRRPGVHPGGAGRVRPDRPGVGRDRGGEEEHRRPRLEPLQEGRRRHQARTVAQPPPRTSRRSRRGRAGRTSPRRTCRTTRSTSPRTATTRRAWTS
jgi:signal peptide peptidase SppA